MTTYEEIHGAKERPAYDKIPRNVMWWALEKHKVQTKYIALIKDMYDNVVTSVWTSDGDTDDSLIKIGLHQGVSFEPLSFTLVMDKVTRRYPMVYALRG